MNNLTEHFYKSGSATCFLNRIEPTERLKETLVQGRKTIRDELRKEIQTYSETEDGGRGKIVPKFYTQGSWVYKTANAPCNTPPQQVDYDDGIYLPVSYHEDEMPKIAAKSYFNEVENVLRKLAKRKGWHLDTSKQTCTRVIISEEAHIDLPLYSIPNKEFELLEEVVLAKTGAGRQYMDSSWKRVAEKKILLAKRDGTWQISDPRKLHDWFTDEVAQKGEQLRRMCRYLKAYRDFQWISSGPSSIFLMVCVTSLHTGNIERDDLRLLQILKGLPQFLEGAINNPTDKMEDLKGKQKESDLQKLKVGAEGFYSDLNKALNEDITIDEASRLIKRHLGDRFPEESVKKTPVTVKLKTETSVRPWTR